MNLIAVGIHHKPIRQTNNKREWRNFQSVLVYVTLIVQLTNLIISTPTELCNNKVLKEFTSEFALVITEFTIGLLGSVSVGNVILLSCCN